MQRSATVVTLPLHWQIRVFTIWSFLYKEKHHYQWLDCKFRMLHYVRFSQICVIVQKSLKLLCNLSKFSGLFFNPSNTKLCVLSLLGLLCYIILLHSLAVCMSLMLWSLLGLMSWQLIIMVILVPICVQLVDQCKCVACIVCVLCTYVYMCICVLCAIYLT